MKKIVNLIGVFLIILFSVNSAYAATITLEQIVEKFNESSIVEYYANAGGSINATSNSDSMNVEVVLDNQTQNLEYILDGNVLSIEIDTEEESSFFELYITTKIIDIIGQLHGYEEGELLKTINSEEANSYTLEDEGYEIENISTTKVKVKVDITKKIPLKDHSNTYIEVEDLRDFKDYISGDGFAEKSKGNVWIYKKGHDGENTVLVAEKDQLTENSYKSILSIIEVMFDSKEVITYFKSNYSGITVGNKEFEGVKIEINPTKTEFEENLIPADSKYKFARITIDKNLVNTAINGNVDNDDKGENDKKEDNNNINKEEETVDNINKDNTQSSQKLPQAGKSTKIFFAIIGIVIIAIVSYKKFTDLKI